MNLEKIGKFIAYNRKKQNLTQEQLAEQLGITKNAVSKWERGLCLMDMSLLEPLSKLLKVSINEILSGETIDKNDLITKADENILNVTKKEVENLKSIRNATIGITLASFLLIVYGLIIDINVSAYFMILSICNGICKYSKYKSNRDKSELSLGIVWLVSSILFLISFVMATIDLSIFTEEIVSKIIMLIFGVLIICLGFMNCKGNINTIHWYNRKRVSKEYEKKYGKCIGIGTIIIGFSIVITSILLMIWEIEAFYYILLVGLILGIVFILYSQIKYNKGIF